MFISFSIDNLTHIKCNDVGTFIKEDPNTKSKVKINSIEISLCLVVHRAYLVFLTIDYKRLHL